MYRPPYEANARDDDSQGTKVVFSLEITHAAERQKTEGLVNVIHV